MCTYDIAMPFCMIVHCISCFIGNISPQLSTTSSPEDMSSLSLQSNPDNYMLTHAGTYVHHCIFGNF